MSLWMPSSAHPTATFEQAALLAAAMSQADDDTYAKTAVLFHALAADTRAGITVDHPECPNCADYCTGHDAVWIHHDCAQEWDECTCSLKHLYAAAKTLIEEQGCETDPVETVQLPENAGV